MLDPKFVADHFDTVQQALARRSPTAVKTLDGVRELAQKRRQIVAQTESKQSERNAANQKMVSLKKSGDNEAFAAQREQLKTLSHEVKDLEGKRGEVEAELTHRLMHVPNIPHASVPDGQDESANVCKRTWGEAPTFDFEAKSHYELGERLGILDFERASKLSGARFSVLMGQGARLERALAQYMIDLQTKAHGYTEVSTPYLVRSSALMGTSQLPKFEEDLFKTARSAGDEDSQPLYLIPTAEVPVTNLHADEILDRAELPLSYAALTPCFRSEAGSYGKDVRGLIRQHQFLKTEMVRFVPPEDSLDELELLVGHAEAVLQGLGLHYRVVELCTGDLSFAAMKCYDIEVWLPAQGAFREISSCSCFGDFQARRAKIRFRPEAKAKPRLVHTLNGSGLAVGRTLVAILEQYQEADGSVNIPEVLRGYMGTDRLSA